MPEYTAHLIMTQFRVIDGTHSNIAEQLQETITASNWIEATVQADELVRALNSDGGLVVRCVRVEPKKNTT